MMAPLDPTFVNACKVISLIAFAASLAWFVMVFRRESAAAARKPAPPAARPAPPGQRTPASSSTTKVSAPSVNAGLAAHQQRSVAKTAKVPAVERPATPASPPPAPAPAPAPAATRPPAEAEDADDQAMGSLFSGLATPSPSAEAERKVSRLQELGFHHSISPSDGTDKTGAGTPRSNTAQLTSILERIDQFLADEPKEGAKAETPAAAAAAAKPAEPAKPAASVDPHQAKTEPIAAPKPAEAKPEPAKPPLWARPDAVDEDVSRIDKPAEGEQQRLF